MSSDPITKVFQEAVATQTKIANVKQTATAMSELCKPGGAVRQLATDVGSLASDMFKEASASITGTEAGNVSELIRLGFSSKVIDLVLDLLKSMLTQIDKV